MALALASYQMSAVSQLLPHLDIWDQSLILKIWESSLLCKQESMYWKKKFDY